MKVLITYILAIWASFSALAQVRQPAGRLNVNSSPFGIVNEIQKFDDVDVSGQYYLLEEWNSCIIDLKNGSGWPIDACKYNLETEQVEIRVEDKVKALNIRLIKELRLIHHEQDTSSYAYSIGFFSNGRKANSLAEIVLKGKSSLIILHELTIQRANYIPALDVGERKDSYVKKVSSYLWRDDRLYPLKSSKKDWLQAFGKHAHEVQEYAKKNKLKYKKKEDMVKLLEYCNQKEW